ncbi:MAG TPA: M20/M25/M40 family metallo-hydrolase [Bryobacteraceae bacterium]|nr:M20/M25/M40 family metallo-hydrolase [Bryobacteraceae bacterium]
MNCGTAVCRAGGIVCWVLSLTLLRAQPGYPSRFRPALASEARVASALRSIAGRQEQLIQDWIRLAEIPASSGAEQARAEYVRGQLAAMGFPNVRTDEMGNVIAERPGTDPKGPVIAFAAHMDTVFGSSVSRKVRRENGRLYGPGIGDDSAGLAAQLEMFRALQKADIRTRGELVFVATVQEETRLRGARAFLAKSGIRPDMFVAVDIWLGEVWYGALRISRLKFFYTSPGAHTLFSRGQPSPARALAAGIQGVYGVQLPPVEPGMGGMKLPVVNIGTLGGGTVVNAIPREAWFTVDLRSLDSATQDRLESEVVRAAKAAADQEGVGFRVEKPQGEDVDFSQARSREIRRAHPLVQTAVDIQRYLHLTPPGSSEPLDMGSTDANVAVGTGMPAIAVGAARYTGPHTLDEVAEESSIVPGTKMLLLLAASLAGLGNP